MPKIPMSQEDEFYQELDKKTEKKSSCSLWGMAIFFTLLFLVLGGVLYLIVRNFKAPVSISNHGNDNIQIDITAKDPTVEIPISEDDLTSILQVGLKGGGANITDARARISSSEIEIDGKLDVLLKTKVALVLLPLVQNEKLYFKVRQIKTWKISLPGIMRVGIERSLNNLMDNNLVDFYASYKVSDLQLSDKKLTIFGNLK